jgi:hypothetical protein
MAPPTKPLAVARFALQPGQREVVWANSGYWVFKVTAERDNDLVDGDPNGIPNIGMRCRYVPQFGARVEYIQGVKAPLVDATIRADLSVKLPFLNNTVRKASEQVEYTFETSFTYADLPVCEYPSLIYRYDDVQGPSAPLHVAISVYAPEDVPETVSEDPENALDSVEASV